MNLVTLAATSGGGLVQQRGTDYTVSGSTLTIVGRTTPLDLIYVVYRPS